MTRTTQILALLPVLALACTDPTKPSDTSSSTASPPTAPSEQQPGPSTPEPIEPKPTQPQTAAPTPEPTSPFELVAVREGPLDLTMYEGQPYLLVSGEPIAIDARARLQREPDMAAGLQPRDGRSPETFHTIAFGGTLAGEAWVTTVQEHTRAAAEYDVHARREGRWQRQALEQGPIIEFYADYVARAGALLGLRAYSSNPLQDVFVGYEGGEDTSPEALEFRRELDAALTKAPRGFVRLAGPTPSAMPKLPDKLEPFAAVTTSDGSLYALALPVASGAKGKDGDAGNRVEPLLLVWPPGEREATQLALPGYEGGRRRTSLSASGDVALVGGASGWPYLALARGTSIEALTMNGFDTLEAVSSAAISPSGELWIVLGHRNTSGGFVQDRASLWTRAAGEAETWSPLHLPTPTGSQVATESRWSWDVHRGGWAECQRSEPEPEPHAQAVVYAHGAAWVLADIGYLGDCGLHRTGLFTTAAATASITELEPFDITLARKYAALEGKREPGDADCPYISLVLGDPAQARAFEAKLDQLDLGSVDGVGLLELYVGELAGTRELVLGMDGDDRERAKAGVQELARLLGIRKAVVDCRPRLLVEMIADELNRRIEDEDEDEP